MRVTILTSEVTAAALAQLLDWDLYCEKLGELFTYQIKLLDLIPQTVGAAEISLTLMNEAEMSAANNEYRNIDAAADVLSFPMWEETGVFTPPSDWEKLPLGDILVCPEVVGRNASADKKTFVEEMTLVLCHGFLHLLGFDHDTEEREKQMWFIQSKMTELFSAGDFNAG